MDADTLADLFAAFEPVHARRMFGGSGLYAGGLMFAIEVDGTIYLKADAPLAEDLAARGCVPFSYLAKGVVRTMSGFWSVPESALDDGEDLAALARRSLAVAQAAALGKAAGPNAKGRQAGAEKARPVSGGKGTPRAAAEPAGAAPPRVRRGAKPPTA